jgi:hypothetical protein
LIVRHLLMPVIDAGHPIDSVAQQDQPAVGVGTSVLPQAKGNVGLESRVMDENRGMLVRIHVGKANGQKSCTRRRRMQKPSRDDLTPVDVRKKTFAGFTQHACSTNKPTQVKRMPGGALRNLPRQSLVMISLFRMNQGKHRIPFLEKDFWLVPQ